jgi:hypothetical protein
LQLPDNRPGQQADIAIITVLEDAPLGICHSRRRSTQSTPRCCPVSATWNREYVSLGVDASVDGTKPFF